MSIAWLTGSSFKVKAHRRTDNEGRLKVVRRFFLRRFSGLHARMFLLVLVVCAPLVGLLVHSAWQDRRNQIDEWKQRSREISELATRQEKRLIGETRQLLIAVAQSGAVRSGSPQRSKRLLDELFSSYPRYDNLGVVRSNGTVFAAAMPRDGVTNIAGKAFFERVVATRKFAHSGFPSATSRGKRTIDFGYPVIRSNEVQAVVFATLDLDLFNRFGSEIPAQMPREAVWTELNPDGSIRVQYPVPDGTNTTIEGVFPPPDIRNRKDSVLETIDEFGQPVFHAYHVRKSEFAPSDTISVLSIPSAILFAGTERALLRNLGGLAIAGSIAGALGWVLSRFLVVKPARRLAESTTRLAAGDFSVRTGLQYEGGELGEISRSFDQMAQALEIRELERQLAERELKDFSRRLQALSHRLVEVQESERRQIARELHDEIGQSLTVAEMNLQMLLETASDQKSIKRLQESIAMIERVLDQVQDISLSLRPSMLDDLGLVPALRWYVQRQGELAGWDADVIAEPFDRRLDPVLETECFRVAQEALTNVARHAHAKTVTVELQTEKDRLHLSICDDGVGFEVAPSREKAVRGASLGLLSMEERAVLAGGGLEVIASPGRGTEVHAWFPLKWREPEIKSDNPDHESQRTNDTCPAR